MSPVVFRMQGNGRDVEWAAKAFAVWNNNHAGVPPDLETILQDAGVSEAPIDPYGRGEPLRFTVINGEPVIYSVGPDGNDDQGLIEWNLRPRAPGDITFRLETREEHDRRRR